MHIKSSFTRKRHLIPRAPSRHALEKQDESHEISNGTSRANRWHYSTKMEWYVELDLSDMQIPDSSSLFLSRNRVDMFDWISSAVNVKTEMKNWRMATWELFELKNAHKCNSVVRCCKLVTYWRTTVMLALRFAVGCALEVTVRDHGGAE